MVSRPEIQQLSDNELIERYKASSDKALVGELYKRYTKFVFAVSMKYLKDTTKCEEAVMQIFEKLFSDLLKHNVENFKSWLHVVTKNYCLLQLRSESYEQKKVAEIKINSEVFMENHEYMYHDNADEPEKKFIMLENAINNLSDEQKTCIELFYLQEKCYDEVSKMTGYSMNQVKSYIQNGKRNLKIFLSNNK